jgi:hypothetical protein
MAGEDKAVSKKDRDVLSDAVARMIDITREEASVAPDSIASGAMEVIKFRYDLHNAGWYGCYQHMLQLARDRLRGRFDPEARAAIYLAGQSELFDDALQDRYPRAPRREPDGSWAEPEYVLRNYLSEDDCWFNIDRMEHVAGALTRHHRALREETVERFGPRKGRAA